jgi:hypothetical protein
MKLGTGKKAQELKERKEVLDVVQLAADWT